MSPLALALFGFGMQVVAADVAGAPAAPASQAAVTPPVLVEAPPPVIPASLREARTVELLVTVATSGRVSEVGVVEPGLPECDAAAVAAVMRWQFVPARRGDEAVAARIRVPILFPAAAAPSSLPAVAASTPGSAPAEPAASDELADAVVVSVRGKKTVATRAVSDFVLDRTVLGAAPHRDAADLLRTAPGVYVSKPEGDAVAHQIFLRGFDAEHGQDIELTMGGIALNRVSHIHGQGYADLNLVMPEIVRSVRVTEGVYDPAQGDFAVAGSIDFDLGVSERGVASTTRYGRFNTFRQALVFAPHGEADETFAAAAFSRSDGFGRNRGGLSGGAIAQYAFTLPGNLKGLVHAAAHGARAGLAGVLRYDDITAGLVDFYGSYDDPSALAQSALSARAQIMASIEHTASSGSRSHVQLALVTTAFSIRQNFTGYLQRSIQRPEWVGRGDLIEQRNSDYTVSARAEHRFAPFRLTDWMSGTFTGGVAYRADFVTQTQNLLQQPRNETWDKRIDASVNGHDIGAWADLQLRATRFVLVRVGARADALVYSIDDALANQTTSFRREQYFPGYRRTALGIAAGPRASVKLMPLPALDVTLAYGEGYRSPQARILEEGELAPFAKVRSAELGGEWRALDAGRLTLQLAGYATFLSSDLAFEAAEGRLEQIGATSRKGAVLRVTSAPLGWLFASVSATYVHATLDAPPPATPENPQPAYVPGQLLPYVPPLVVRADIAAFGTLTSFGNGELRGRIGLGLSALSARPLPYGQFSQPFATLDAQASLGWRWFELGVEVMNLLDARYAANDYSFVSSWPNRSLPSQVPTRHISAAAPLTLMGVLGIKL